MPTTSQATISITDDDIRVFSHGACHVLAHEIQKLTGWPIHCFLGWNDEPDMHAFIVPLPGWRLDVRGLSLAFDHDKFWAWDPDYHRLFSYKEIVACWGARETGWASEQARYRRRAKKIAPLLVSAFARDHRIALKDRRRARTLVSSCQKPSKSARTAHSRRLALP